MPSRRSTLILPTQHPTTGTTFITEYHYFDLTAGGGLTQYSGNSTDRTQPALFICKFCQLGKMDSLR